MSPYRRARRYRIWHDLAMGATLIIAGATLAMIIIEAIDFISTLFKETR